MPGPIDDTLKHLTELSPQDWVVQGGWSAAPATLIDADIATISGAADKVIRVAGSPDWLLAINFQAGHDTGAKLPDLLLYILHAATSDTFSKVWKLRVRRESMASLCLEGRSSRHCWMAVWNSP